MVIASEDWQDELNVIHAINFSSPTPESFPSNPGSSPGAKSSLKFGSPGQRKRGRSFDLNGEVVEGNGNAKKAKREERKAVSIPPFLSR